MVGSFFSDIWTSLHAVYKERDAYARYVVGLWVGLAVCLASLYGFIAITEALLEHQVAGFDNAVSSYVHSWRTPVLTSVFTALTELGDIWGYGVVLLLVAVCLYLRKYDWKLSIQAGIVLLTTGAINIVIKSIIGRERPSGEHLVVVSAQSFPSGHSMSCIAFYGFLIYLGWHYFPRRWMKIANAIVLTLLIAAIGTSRVYLGVHYPSDVAAGFVGGLFWLVVCILVFRTFRYRKEKREQA